MPRRQLLSPVQRATLLSIPTDTTQLARHYTLTARDRSLIRAKRGAHNELGFAIQLAYLRFTGQPMSANTEPPPQLVSFMARQLRLKATAWADYALRDETRREHAVELQAAFGYETFTVATYRRVRGWLTELALQTHKAVSLAEQLVERLRDERILLPTTDALDRICSEAVTRGTRLLHTKLVGPLSENCRNRLDRLLLPRDSTRTVTLTWLQHPPGEAKAKNILSHLDRLNRIRAVELPPSLGLLVHQGRLTELAREGALMSAQHLRDVEPMRRHALLAALVLDLEATITDQIFEMHDRVIGRLFTDAKRKHEQRFTAAGKAINDKVRLYARVGHALMDAREQGGDPYAAIEAVLPWDLFTRSVKEADQLAQPASFDPLPLLVEGYRQGRRYAPRLLDTFDFRAAPVARDVLDGIDALRRLYRGPGRTLPATTPTDFLRKRWEPFVVTAIILWNTVYLERAIAKLGETGRVVNAAWLPHLAPVHWEHINLTGDYSWRPNQRIEKGGFRPLRPPRQSYRTL